MKSKKLIKILEQQLKKANVGEVTSDRFSDGSCSWITIRNNDEELIISFDGKGENITDVELWKDIIEVVRTEKIWGK